jgi:hypothetical protein
MGAFEDKTPEIPERRVIRRENLLLAQEIANKLMRLHAVQVKLEELLTQVAGAEDPVALDTYRTEAATMLAEGQAITAAAYAINPKMDRRATRA